MTKPVSPELAAALKTLTQLLSQERNANTLTLILRRDRTARIECEMDRYGQIGPTRHFAVRGDSTDLTTLWVEEE